ncbi:unnamed protein product, partial [Iphiclides podalirius]
MKTASARGLRGAPSITRRGLCQRSVAGRRHPIRGGRGRVGENWISPGQISDGRLAVCLSARGVYTRGSIVRRFAI